MANEIRKHQNSIGGLIENADTLADGSLGLTAAGTSLSSAGLAAISGGVSSTQHMVIVLDPDGLAGAPEECDITALSAGTTSATIVRGRNGTTARDHQRDTPWVHAYTTRDIGVAWTTYTPAWTSSGTAPAIGNGTLKGRYMQIGKTLHFSITVVMGSTTTFGTGDWGFGLPSNITGVSDSGIWQLIPVYAYDTSAGSHNTSGLGRVLSGQGSISLTTISNAFLSPTVPWTWANGDELHYSGTIEIA